MDLAAQAAGIGALADDTRRALYAYVVGQPDAVTREQAAQAIGLAPATAYFHLDKLVAEGLLATESRRLSGKAGPGAGRPSKLYRRAEREFAVSLPERRYDLVGQILAEAVTRAGDGAALDDALATAAREQGTTLGGAAAGIEAGLPGLAQVLAGQGYEPRLVDDTMELANCPFDALAKEHTALVCGLNQSFVQGVADGLGCGDTRACLEPEAGRCCVTVRSSVTPGGGSSAVA